LKRYERNGAGPKLRLFLGLKNEKERERKDENAKRATRRGIKIKR
jgi:hypothetical protein